MKKFVYDQGKANNPLHGDNITMSIFFDGTQNNKTNTETGKPKREKIQEQSIGSYTRFINPEPKVENTNTKAERGPLAVTAESYLKEVTVTAIKEKGDSYENDYTNVARLYYAYKLEKGVQENIYIEGVGTEDGKPDDRLAVGMGICATSVRGKARKACTDIFTRLNKYKKSKINLLTPLPLMFSVLAEGLPPLAILPILLLVPLPN